MPIAGNLWLKKYLFGAAQNGRFRWETAYMIIHKATGPDFGTVFIREKEQEKDLGGKNALLSNHFYYFGLDARSLPENLKDMIWQG